MSAQRYTLRARHEEDSWWATCDEVAGYVLGAPTLEQLRRDFDFGLREVLDVSDPEIVVVLEDSSTHIAM